MPVLLGLLLIYTLFGTVDWLFSEDSASIIDIDILDSQRVTSHIRNPISTNWQC